jgi:hypothetical protein
MLSKALRLALAALIALLALTAPLAPVARASDCVVAPSGGVCH